MIRRAQNGDGWLLEVKVVPNSSRTAISGVLGGALKIKVAQPPEKGKANEAVIEALAEFFQISGGHLSIVSGHTRARKVIHIAGATEEQLRRRLATLAS